MSESNRTFNAGTVADPALETPIVEPRKVRGEVAADRPDVVPRQVVRERADPCAIDESRNVQVADEATALRDTLAQTGS
jgi:hypothetical protein